jgi:hypothetical protein
VSVPPGGVRRSGSRLIVPPGGFDEVVAETVQR